MIIWLASYPRSGNTLLRTMIKQTMGVRSYSDEFEESNNNVLTAKTLDITGKIISKGDWPTFYAAATKSEKVFLVKTHHLPRDSQPAIYVVRDGRKALVSYSRFHESFTPSPFPSLLQLILGLDYYGSWSDHIDAWVHRENTLIIKYEELLNPTAELIIKLATHIGHTDRIFDWRNPFDELKVEDPKFFREGTTAWLNDDAWTPAIEKVFIRLHGQQLTNLNYSTATEVMRSDNFGINEIYELIDITKDLNNKINQLQTVCDERLKVIEILKHACDERLSLIETLNKRLS